jgi:hypothetical protein
MPDEFTDADRRLADALAERIKVAPVLPNSVVVLHLGHEFSDDVGDSAARATTLLAQQIGAAAAVTLGDVERLELIPDEGLFAIGISRVGPDVLGYLYRQHVCVQDTAACPACLWFRSLPVAIRNRLTGEAAVLVRKVRGVEPR